MAIVNPCSHKVKIVKSHVACSNEQAPCSIVEGFRCCNFPLHRCSLHRCSFSCKVTCKNRGQICIVLCSGAFRIRQLWGASVMVNAQPSRVHQIYYN